MTNPRWDTDLGGPARSLSFRYADPSGAITIEIDPDCDFTALVERFREFALALGYHPDTVEEYFSGSSSTVEIGADAG